MALLEISKQILMDMGNFTFDQATCVDEALKKLSTGQYDIIVSDYEMPRKNGLEFLKELREQNNQIPFILFTGKGREDVAVKALNLGAAYYVNKNGSPETVYCELANAINKTFESVKSKKLLATSDSNYRLLVEKSLQGVLVTEGSPLKLVFANEAMGRILGYSRQELIALSSQEIMRLIVDEDRDILFKRMKNRLNDSHIDESYEFRAHKKDGTIIWLKALANRVEYDGKPAIQSMFLDITESKKLELELKEKYDVLERVGESIGAGLAVIDKNYEIFWANERLRDAIVDTNKKCYQTFNKLNEICPECGVKKVFEENATLDIHEFKTVNSKGGTTWIELRVTPLKDKNGNVTAALELAVPITERKEIETKLRKSQHLTEKMLFCSPNLIYIYDLTEKCNVYSNKEVLTFLGYTPEKIKEMGPELFANILHPEDTQNVDQHHARFENAPDNAVYDIEYRMKHASGEWRWLRSRDTLFSRTQNGMGKQILGYCEDITESKKAEDRLRNSEKRYRILADSLPEIVCEADADGKLVFVNERAFDITGYSLEEFERGLNILEFIIPEQREEAAQNLHELLSTGTHEPTEYTFLRKDGTTFPALITATARITNNKIDGIRGLVIDITQRKKAEETAIENQLRLTTMNEKLHVIGGLTRHDMGNKLMAIKANAFLLKKHICNRPELIKYLENIETAVNASKELFEFSSLYEKIGIEEPTEINIEKCFNQAISIIMNLGSIKIINESQNLEVVADSLLRQFFFNLVDNSLKHGEKVTQIRIHYISIVDNLKIIYEDDGIGISEENKPKIFTDGFTTGKGSGLGLKLIKKITEVYGWKIAEEGEPGKGAKFVITVPRFNQARKENYRLSLVSGE